MREIQKTSIEKISNVKRERRRKRLQPFFYFIVVVLVLILIVTLSMTVLFNIKTIRVEGNSEYEPSQIVEASGIYKGDNLVRLNTENAKQKILNNLMYIDDVTIKKEFPSTLIIQTTASVPAMNIQDDNDYILVSEGLKRLSDSSDTPQENLLSVIGFEPKIVDDDTKLQSEDEQKPKILDTIYTELKDLDILDKIVSIDITDKYDIVINYSDRIYIKLGSYSDLEYKIRYANTVITQNILEQKSGYLIFVNSNSASFVEKDKYDEYSSRVEEATMVSDTTTDISSLGIDTISTDETFNFIETDLSTSDIQEVTTPYSEYSNYDYQDGDSIIYGTTAQ